MLNVEKMYYIGDTKTGMATAINAGIDGIGVGWALTSKEDLLVCWS